MATAMAQMNVRLERDLKEQGDAALSAAGYSPTQAVRELWRYAASHRRDPQAVRRYLSPEGSAKETEAEEQRRADRERRLASLHATQKMIADFYEARGIQPSPEFWNRPYKELLEEAYAERYIERGLL